MSDAAIWTVIAGLGLGTFAIRFSFLGMLGGREVPVRLRRALGFVPAAVLPALVAPMVLTGPGGAIAVEPAELAAAMATLLAGVATRNVLIAILAGLAGHLAALALL